MPRAFTVEEKKRIRASLINAGRKCFLTYGMKKTTIEDLVSTARIAKSTFYQFYSSKEKLYHELFTQEIPAMMKRLYASSFGCACDTRDALILLMKAIAQEVEGNELARVVLDDPSQLMCFLSTPEYESLVLQIAQAYAPMVEALREAQSRGEIIDRDPNEIAQCLSMVKLLAVHKDNMPEGVYASLLDLVPEVIADGLTCPVRTPS